MRRFAVLLILGVGGLLITPGAAKVSAPSSATRASDALALDIQFEITGTLGLSNWYVSNVTVRWFVTGETSHDCTTRTLSVDTPGERITCNARNDDTGEEASKSVTIKLDKTAPGLTPVPVPAPNGNGWHREKPLTITFPGTDGMSGIAGCTADQPYTGGDSTGTAITGSCTDKAGNPSGPKTYTVKYDATAPTLVPDPEPNPNADGWHRQKPLTIKFPGTDETSGIATCTADQPYTGGDTNGTPITGSCTDNAGNASGLKTYTVKYDETAPTLSPVVDRGPNPQGWYVLPLSVRFPGADGTSGIAICSPETTYNGPDRSSATVDGFCTDNAGNRTDRSYAFRYDATAPNLVPDPEPNPNALGWHRQKPLTIKFSGTDETSGIATCTADQPYTGGDTNGTPITGSCTDRAGNASGLKTYTVKYDGTAPTLVADPVPDPNALGWHRQKPLVIRFPGNDATSGIAGCTGDQPYTGNDTTGTPINGFCTDNAGNRTDAGYTVKYDATAPTLAADPDPSPNANGWHREKPLTIKFRGLDGTSGIAACTADQPYTGGDTPGTPISGFCTDKAGNRTDSGYTVRYDATAPTLVAGPEPNPNANGWHRQKPLTIRFPGLDGTSGIATCTADQPYTGNDTTGTTINGFCTDKAGNRTDSPYTVKYDATAPQLTAAPSRGADVNGWHNHELTIRFPGSDATSQIEVCTPDVAYTAPDTATASVTGSCTDKAGNTTTKSYDFKYDDSAPQITPSPSRQPDSNGWYNEPLAVTFAGSDATSGLQASCGSAHRYDGPDGVFAVISGTCADNAGNVGFGSMAIKYDATAPQVTGASTDRAPDGNGWFNHPLSIRFQGTDATSDIDSCSAVDYGGPNNLNASVSGSCRDRAGNESGTNAYSFKYDSSPPSLTKFTVKALNRSALLTWETSADTTFVEILRTRGANGARVGVYRGTGRTFTDTGLENGVRYRYTFTGFDEAHNAATMEAGATPLAPLVSPKAGAVVSAPPRLAWRAVPKATYYNAQVWRNGRIFSAWPRGTSVQLKRRWVYNGRRYRLTPGRYRWYVWPGFGKRAKKDFGKLIGSSSFVVR
jgi:large repetitive protein